VKIAFIYRKNQYYIAGNRKAHHDNTFHHFFFSALPRCKEVDITFCFAEKVYDALPLKGKFDIVMLYDVIDWGAPDRIINLDKLKIPIVLDTTDCHHAAYRRHTKNGKLKPELAKEYGVTHCFFQHSPRYFYQFWPKEFPYYQMFFGVEISQYATLTPFQKRRKDKLLNTGQIDNKDHYVLRKRINSHPSVKFVANNRGVHREAFANLLGSYRAAIAACTTCTVMKYIEVAAAGCVPFLEVTERNDAHLFGFEDGVQAVHITPANYVEKIEEYMQTLDAPRWARMAQAAREHVLANYTNDEQARRFVRWLKTL